MGIIITTTSEADVRFFLKLILLVVANVVSFCIQQRESAIVYIYALVVRIKSLAFL